MTRLKYLVQDYGLQVVFTLVVVVAVIALTISNHHKSSWSKHVPVALASESSTVSSSGSISTTPNPSQVASDPQVLQMVAIIKAYYLLHPNDTVSTRKLRMKGLLPDSALQTLDFSVGHTSCSDQLRLKEQLTEQATVSLTSYSAEKVRSDGLAYVTIPVTVHQYDKSGNIVKDTATCVLSEDFRVFFNWKPAGNSWVLSGFGDPASHWPATVRSR